MMVAVSFRQLAAPSKQRAVDSENQVGWRQTYPLLQFDDVMSSPENRNAIVLVIDRIGANMLGAYGNTWFETDNFNRLAARSLLFEQVISSSPTLDSAYRDLWSATENAPDLPRQIGESGANCVLLTDEPVVADLPLAAAFDRVIPIGHADQPSTASNVEQTESANFFAQATQWMTTMEPGTFGWLHSRGLSGAWDAPYEFRQRLADSEDPDPPRFVQPPSTSFNAGQDDPDQLLGYQQACAAQVMLIDDFLGVILDLMETDSRWQSTMFCLLSTRGYPLGEHHQVGAPANDPSKTGDSDDARSVLEKNAGADTLLYEETMHVPLLVCLPERSEYKNAQAVRHASLIQPSWLSEFLSDWFTGSQETFERRWQSVSYSLPEPRQEAVCTVHEQVQAIQTQAWKLVRKGDQVELFVKPDDRWEVSDVSSRCPRIVEQLSALLDQWIVAGKVQMPANFVLADELATRAD